MTDMSESMVRAWLQGPVREFLTHMPELADLPPLEGDKRGRLLVRMEVAKSGLRELVYELANAYFGGDLDLAKKVAFPKLTPKGRLKEYSDGILRVLGIPTVQWKYDSGDFGYVSKDWLPADQARQASEALERVGIKASWAPDTETNGMAWLYAQAPEVPQ
jgi:hypothetical protein